MQILKCIPATKIPLPNEQELSYYCSENLKKGALVRVPLRGRDTPAVVTEAEPIKNKKSKIKQKDFELKNINSILTEENIFDSQYIELLQWSSKYWWESIGLFLKNALIAMKDAEFYHSLSVKQPSEKSPRKDDFWFPKRADKNLKESLKRIKKEKKQALVLAPEIEKLHSLSDKLKEAGIDFKLYSGETTKKDKKEVWKKILGQNPFVLIGTKKALFLPWKNLSKLIVADEGNTHYKAWGRHPKYHAKHLAYKLAHLQGADLILTANAPSLQSYKKFQESKGADFALDKINENLKRESTQFQLINRSEEEGWGNIEEDFSYISEQTKKLIEETLGSNKDSRILFLHPRRGSATAILCKDCGHIFSCPNCSVSFTFHKNRNKMVCHYCGKEEPPPTTCSKCGSDKLKYGGIGTQKLEEMLGDLFPESRGLRLDGDTARKDKKKKKIVKQFKEEDYDYLIATQMVLSSKLDSFDLVFIPNLDLFLDRPDFRAFERTLYLLKKLESYSDSIIAQTFAGHERFTQTYQKENYGDFYKKELKNRESFFYPPFSQLTKLETKAKQKKESLKQAKILKKKIRNYLERKNSKEIKVLGPSPDFPIQVRGKYRHKLILKVPRDKLGLRNEILAFVGNKWEINVEPVQL